MLVNRLYSEQTISTKKVFLNCKISSTNITSISRRINRRDFYNPASSTKDVFMHKTKLVVKRTNKPKNERYKTFKRYLSENKKLIILFRHHLLCNWVKCKRKLAVHKQSSRKLFEFDHIIPFSNCGKTSLDNMQELCLDCHAIKTGYDFA